MPLSLRGKTAIITGASAGIGRAVAQAFAREGVRSALAGRRREELEKTAQAVADLGGEAIIVPTDVSQESELENLVAKTMERFGALDILVNNAGVYLHLALEKLEKKQLEDLFAVNLVAPMMLTKLALPHLKKTPGSAVINVASIAGLQGFSKGSAYSASKFAVVGFTQCLFEEVREEGIKVCAICPGYVATPMTDGYSYLDMEKMIPPEDVAETIVDVLKLSVRSCPAQIIVRPQYSPVRPR